jgi:hypothetical protein
VIFDAVPTGGSLAAVGETTGSGIGGCDGQNCGAITIVGGTIRAYGGTSGAAGIGGGAGYSGSGTGGGTISISGGDVTAFGGHGGAGIGCGEGGAESMVDISISGGIVTAAGGSSGGASIGGDNYKGGWTVNISGGIVHAVGAHEQLPGIIGSPPRATATLLPRSGSITGSNTVVITDLIHSNIACEGGLIATNGRGRLLSDHVSIPHS